jgi:hypothetical protein
MKTTTTLYTCDLCDKVAEEAGTDEIPPKWMIVVINKYSNPDVTKTLHFCTECVLAIHGGYITDKDSIVLGPNGL